MVNDTAMTSAVNLRTFNGTNAHVYSEPRAMNNAKYMHPQESTAFTGYGHPERNGSSSNRLAMNNVNYEQSYPVHSSFKSPEKLVKKHVVGPVNTASQPSTLKPPCSTFKNPTTARKSSVIRIDARDYSENAEPDLPPAAMTLPRAMNPLTNYSSTTTTLTQKQSTAPGYLQRNASKTSLYAPSSICHLIATTTPPPQVTSEMGDLPEPPNSANTFKGSPTLRRQQSQNGLSARAGCEYTVAGDHATMRRSHPGTNVHDTDHMYPSPYVSTLPYRTLTKATGNVPASAEEIIKECEGYSNKTYSVSTKESAASDAGKQVPFAPAKFADSGPKKLRKSSSSDSKGSKSSGKRSKDSATYKFPQKPSISKQTSMVEEEKKSRVLDRRSLWCMIAMLIILLLVSIIFMIHFATQYEKLRREKLLNESTSPVVPPVVPVTETTEPRTNATTLPPTTEPTTIKAPDDFCLTEDCIWSSGVVAQKMNRSVDPCSDFYEYACGGWIRDNYMPPDLSHYGVVSKIKLSNERLLYESLIRDDNPISRDLRGSGAMKNMTDAEKKAQAFFLSCLDLGRINMLGAQPMLDMIKEIGGWSPLGNWNQSKWDLNELLYVIQGQQSISVFFSMSVEPGFADESDNILRIDQDGVTLPALDFYINDNRTSHNIWVVTAYKRLISTLLRLLGAQNFTQSVEEIYGFEKELAKIIAAQPDTSLNQGGADNLISIKRLNKLCREIDWFRLLQRIISKTSLNLSTKVFVLSRTYIEALSQLLSRTPPRTLHNYMLWRAVVTKASYLSSPFRKAMTEFSSALFGARPRRPVYKDCLLEVNKHFGVATGVMFVREAFSVKNKREVEGIADNIKRSFRRHLQEVRWMDDKTKFKAVEKLNNMIVDIGYQEELFRDRKFLNEQYKFDVSRESYFKNILNSIQYKISQRVDKIFNSPKGREWTISPQTMNAFYAPSNNRVIFPAGILQSPLYDDKFPMAINYGAIGSKIGHELTHGYDSLGKDYDKEGNVNPWWSSESSSRFGQRSKCVIRQYNKYSIGDLYVNGQNTLEENIADIAGLKVAHKAYKTWQTGAKYSAKNKKTLPGLELTDDQLFFVGFAQTWCMKRLPASYRKQFQGEHHAPERFRVQGSVSQFKEFAKAFNCPPSSPMNPPFKCLVW